MELRAAASSGVALGRQPAGHPPGGEPGRPLGAGEAQQEGHRDGRGQVVEEVHGSGEDPLEVGTELLHEAKPGPHEVLACPHARAQGHGRGQVGPERAQAMPVGPQDVGEDVGVGAVVLVAGAAVAGAQGLDPAAGDDDDPQLGLEERIDERPVGSLDGHAHDLPGGESPRERL